MLYDSLFSAYLVDCSPGFSLDASYKNLSSLANSEKLRLFLVNNMRLEDSLFLLLMLSLALLAEFDWEIFFS